MSSRQIGTTTKSRRAPQNTLHAHARARPKTPKSASAVLRLATTHGPKVRPIVPLALRCRNISQGLIGMGSMPLRYQLHTYFPSARCRRWFRQCCHTKREEREGRDAGDTFRQGCCCGRCQVHSHQYSHSHTHPRTQPRPHHDRQATGKTQMQSRRKSDAASRQDARQHRANVLGVLQTHTNIM